MRACLIIALVLLLASCSAQSQNCIENINIKPMYGKVKKCPEQVEADNIFLAECDKNYVNRKEAALQFINRGWGYVYSNKLDTAMMRFNQAWMLDSLNADVYWGYGNILGMQGKFKPAISHFERSLKLKADNPLIWHDLSNIYGNLFFETKDSKFLNKAVYALKNAIALDRQNPMFYAKLTATYCYLTQKDSARKYYKIANKLDPNSVSPQVRAFLEK